MNYLPKKKKVMGPGSIIEGKMSKGRRLYKNSLSSKVILGDDILSRLKSAELIVGSIKYRSYDAGNEEVKTIYKISKKFIQILTRNFVSKYVRYPLEMTIKPPFLCRKPKEVNF